MTVREALARGADRLASIPGAPRQDAESLMASALGTSVGEMLLHALDAPAPAKFELLLARRLGGEPMGYVLGRVGFWTIELEVGPGVLIPRADSETLIAAALDHFGPRGPRTILDLGTGPGTLLLAALAQWPEASGIGIDASPAALAFARRNAERLGLASRATLRQGDWARDLDGQFDLVLCNPPYIEEGAALMTSVADWEPAEALFAGADGLDAYRRLAPQLPRLVAPGGIACVEIGAGQEEAVRALLADERFTMVSRCDLNRLVRGLILEAKRA